jgi:hypothetical protein
MSFERPGIEDLTSEKDVVTLMRLSRNEEEWNANCDKVKAANNNDYPQFWYNAIVRSGVVVETKEKWAK